MDLISRQAALDCVTYDEEYTTECIKALPSLQPTCNQLATDVISRKAALDGIADYLEEYDGIDENGNHDLKWCAMKEAELLIKDLPSAQPEIIRCKDCKHFHYDMPYVIQGIPVLGHEVCDFWGDGCKTSENGFCSFAEE